MQTLIDATQDRDWPELAFRARQLTQLFTPAALRCATLLERGGKLRVALQPCIRDIWHDHVLFRGETVSGLVDFGSLRPDNVATDIARLLGSLVGDDPHGWELGLAAYGSVRRVSEDERLLVEAFDRTTVLMGGLEWLQWIYVERKTFDDRTAVVARLDQTLARLRRLVGIA